MMLLWMTYAMLVGTLTALAAFAVDRAARLARIPTRWVWASAIALAIGLAMRAPEVDGSFSVPTFGFASNDKADSVPTGETATGSPSRVGDSPKMRAGSTSRA